MKRFIIGDFSLIRFVRSTLLIYVSFGVIIFFIADRMMFHPNFSVHRDTKDRIMVTAADGVAIAMAHRPAKSGHYTLLFSHGNAEDIGDLEFLFRQLNAIGFSVFAYDYRGFGASEGTPTEKNTYKDIDAAYEYLTSELQVPPDRIIAYGRSIGGGPSTDLATRKPLAGLILESTFVSAFRVLTHVPLLPFDKFENVDKLKDVRCPVLVMHSADDKVIPLWHGKMLFEKAGEPKRFLWVEQAGHGGLPFEEKARYNAALLDFVKLLDE